MTDPGDGRGAAVLDVLAGVRVLPVVTVSDTDVAVPLVAALEVGGCRVVEITLRTPGALDAIRLASAQVPGAIVGAGTVTSVSALHAAVDAGARFVVSPGHDRRVVDAAREAGIPVLPGVATPTELMAALDQGVEVVKLFPAEPLGGVKMLSALTAVWPEVRFVPTGGISTPLLPDYLAIDQVLAVGGSWMVPSPALDAADWPAVTAAATSAVATARGQG